MSELSFTPVDRSDVPKISKSKNTATTKFFDKFLESGQEVAIVDVPEGRKMVSVRSSLQNYVKRNELPVKIFTRNNDTLYLERTDVGSTLSADDAKDASDELANA